MDNYLNHRWPQGPGVQPPPVPSPGSMAPAAPPRPRLRRRWAVYLICGVLGIALLGLVINTATIWLLHHKFRANFYAAKLLATGVVTFWNFFMNYFFNF